MAVVVYTVVAPSGLPRLLSIQREERALTNSVKDARHHNGALADEVRVLQGEQPASRALLEKKAREELGVVAKDEIVLSVPSDVTARTSGTTAPVLSTDHKHGEAQR